MDIVNFSNLYSLNNAKQLSNSSNKIGKHDLNTDFLLDKEQHFLQEKKETSFSDVDVSDVSDVLGSTSYLHSRLLTLNQQLERMQTELSEIQFNFEFTKNLNKNQNWKSSLLTSFESKPSSVIQKILTSFDGGQLDWLEFLEKRQGSLLEDLQKTQISVENLLSATSSSSIDTLFDQSLSLGIESLSDSSSLYQLNIEKVRNLLE